MQHVYMNYAATSCKKPPAVVKAVTRYVNENLHLNAGRNMPGLDAVNIALDARLAVCRFFNLQNPRQVLFTSGVTAALNMVLHGLLKAGDHVLATMIEHNAVARPLHLMQQQGLIEVSWLPCAPDGSLDPTILPSYIRPNTKALVASHASNVLGTILPIGQLFSEAKKYGLVTILDTAQTAGFLPIDAEQMQIDVLAFTGHKSLMGLEGIGGFALRPGVEKRIAPWMTGGTGSASESLEQPQFLPDKYEPGTQNTVGIVSLGTAIAELEGIGISAIQAEEQNKTARLLDGLACLPFTIHGTKDATKTAPVVSITLPGQDVGELAQTLYDTYGVVARSGLHCAPLAHQTAKTISTGTLRLSPGYFTTMQEIDYILEALAQIAGQV